MQVVKARAEEALAIVGRGDAAVEEDLARSAATSSAPPQAPRRRGEWETMFQRLLRAIATDAAAGGIANAPHGQRSPFQPERRRAPRSYGEHWILVRAERSLNDCRATRQLIHAGRYATGFFRWHGIRSRSDRRLVRGAPSLARCRIDQVPDAAGFGNASASSTALRPASCRHWKILLNDQVHRLPSCAAADVLLCFDADLIRRRPSAGLAQREAHADGQSSSATRGAASSADSSTTYDSR